MYRGIKKIKTKCLLAAMFACLITTFIPTLSLAAETPKTTVQQTAAKVAAQAKQAPKVAAQAKAVATNVKAQAQTAAKPAPKKAAAAVKAAVKTTPKIIPSAKSYTERMAELKKAQQKGKKPAAKPKKKVRTQTVDMQIVVWDFKGSSALTLAHEVAAKVTGNVSEYLVKDTVFSSDSSKRICFLRINFPDKLPENWYLESELAVGFGTTKQRAYEVAFAKAATRAKAISDDESAWVGVDCAVKSNTEGGVIPYSVTFESIGSELYCKIFFRYLKERK